MCRAREEAPSRSTCGWIVSLIVLGAGLTVPEARAQGSGTSPYTLATTSGAILYNTGPNAVRGSIQIDVNTAVPSPSTVDVRYDAANGLTPSAVDAVLDVTYGTKTGRYAGDELKGIALNNRGTFTINLNPDKDAQGNPPKSTFTKWLLGQINNTLPPQFDPSAAPGFITSVDVTVSVKPAAAGFQGNATKVNGTLKINLQQVFGAPKDAVEVVKAKAAAAQPTRAHISLATVCPRCSGADDDCGYGPDPMAWLVARGSPAGPGCPSPAYSALPVDDSQTLYYGSPAGRVCWP